MAIFKHFFKRLKACEAWGYSDLDLAGQACAARALKPIPILRVILAAKDPNFLVFFPQNIGFFVFVFL